MTHEAKYNSPILGDVKVSSPMANHEGVYKFKVETKDDTYFIDLNIKSYRKALEMAEKVYL